MNAIASCRISFLLLLFAFFDVFFFIFCFWCVLCVNLKCEWKMKSQRTDIACMCWIVLFVSCSFSVCLSSILMRSLFRGRSISFFLICFLLIPFPFLLHRTQLRYLLLLLLFLGFLSHSISFANAVAIYFYLRIPSVYFTTRFCCGFAHNCFCLLLYRDSIKTRLSELWYVKLCVFNFFFSSLVYQTRIEFFVNYQSQQTQTQTF